MRGLICIAIGVALCIFGFSDVSTYKPSFSDVMTNSGNALIGILCICSGGFLGLIGLIMFFTDLQDSNSSEKSSASHYERSNYTPNTMTGDGKQNTYYPHEPDILGKIEAEKQIEIMRKEDPEKWARWYGPNRVSYDVERDGWG